MDQDPQSKVSYLALVIGSPNCFCSEETKAETELSNHQTRSGFGSGLQPIQPCPSQLCCGSTLLVEEIDIFFFFRNEQYFGIKIWHSLFSKGSTQRSEISGENYPNQGVSREAEELRYPKSAQGIGLPGCCKIKLLRE